MLLSLRVDQRRQTVDLVLDSSFSAGCENKSPSSASMRPTFALISSNGRDQIDADTVVFEVTQHLLHAWRQSWMATRPRRCCCRLGCCWVLPSRWSALPLSSPRRSVAAANHNRSDSAVSGMRSRTSLASPSAQTRGKDNHGFAGWRKAQVHRQNPSRSGLRKPVGSAKDPAGGRTMGAVRRVSQRCIFAGRQRPQKLRTGGYSSVDAAGSTQRAGRSPRARNRALAPRPTSVKQAGRLGLCNTDCKSKLKAQRRGTCPTR